jgi:O-antigen ligase
VKRRVSRVLAVAVPLALLYVAIGWNSNVRGFGPVRTLRTLVDEQADESTMWREIENHNLIHTYSQSPLLGLGFGREFFRPYALPDVTGVYPLENYVPHNSVLGIWAFGGLIGFSLLWVIFPVGMFFAVRAYRWSRTPIERITSLTAAVVQICYLLQAYGDLGFGVWGPVFLLAASYAMVGKICVATGAWPLRVRSTLGPSSIATRPQSSPG